MYDSDIVTVETVRCEAYVLVQQQKHEHSDSVRKQNMRYCKACVNSNKLNCGSSDTISEQESKEPYRKEFSILDYVELDILRWQKRIFNTFSLALP